MAVAYMIPTDSYERMRVGTQQHLPTFASKSGFEPSTGLMDRDTQHRLMTLTARAHELSTVEGHAVLLVTVDNKHNGRLQSTQYIQKYVKCAVCGTKPTNTRANVHNPLSLQLHPPPDHCLHASGRLGHKQPSTFTSIISKGSCATRRTSVATSQPVLRSQCINRSTAPPTAEKAGRSCGARPSSQGHRAPPMY